MNPKTNSDQMPRARQANLLVQELPEEMLVYDLKDHKAHALNKTAAFVWQHADGETTVAQLATMMSKKLHRTVGEDAVWLALKQLEGAGLLEEPLQMPEARISRRQVLRSLGIATMVPLVVSVVAPTALAGASIPPQCTVCLKKGNAQDVSACTGVCNNVCGRCFSNAGCGQGGFQGCTTCGNCFGGPGAPDTVSWIGGNCTC
jgi:hypothetical protein